MSPLYGDCHSDDLFSPCKKESTVNGKNVHVSFQVIIGYSVLTAHYSVSYGKYFAKISWVVVLNHKP